MKTMAGLVAVLCITLQVPCAILLSPSLVPHPCSHAGSPLQLWDQPCVRLPEDIFHATRKGVRTQAALETPRFLGAGVVRIRAKPLILRALMRDKERPSAGRAYPFSQCLRQRLQV